MRVLDEVVVVQGGRKGASPAAVARSTPCRNHHNQLQPLADVASENRDEAIYLPWRSPMLLSEVVS